MLRAHGSRILGLDLGNFKFATCLLNTIRDKALFAAIPSLQALRSHLTELAPNRLALDACSMAGSASDLARELSGVVHGVRRRRGLEVEHAQAQDRPG